MISTRVVSIILLIVWGLFYYRKKDSIISSKVYFALLTIMASGGLLFNPLPLMGLTPTIFNPIYILLFAFLMLIAYVPWARFDNFLMRSPIFTIEDSRISTLKNLFLAVIVLSIYAIIYAFPYTMYAWSMGADAVRLALADDSILPHSILTTLAVGIATFSPVSILLFYISLLDHRLRRYSFFLVISSLAYIVVSMASAARDGFIYTGLTYIVFYLVFRSSYDADLTKKLRKLGIILVGVLASFVLVFSLSRFGSDTPGDNSDMLYGTWGYIYQQPYVFDHILDQFDSFYGFNRRLKFLNDIIPIGGSAYTASTKVEYMFGTQFAEYFMIAGYPSLIIGVLVYLFVFKSIISKLLSRNAYFPALVAFVIYVYFTLSGLFYFRFGGNNSEFLFYMAILFGARFMPNFINVSFSKNPNI